MYNTSSTPTSESVDDVKIKNFLHEFGGDKQAAINALRHYGEAPKLVNRQPENHNRIIVKAENLQRHYQLGGRVVEALKDASFEVHEGEMIALTGASGSGKSTLLHILGCLDRASAGSLIIDDKTVTKMHDTDLNQIRKSKIGFVFQSFYLQPSLNLRDNVMVPAMFAGMPRKVALERSMQLLEQMGLADRAKHFPKAISGGQMQRAALARALMNSPSIIVADEPTGNLDSHNSQMVIDNFQQIRRDHGSTIIIATHDTDIAAACDRQLTLRDGVLTS